MDGVLDSVMPGTETATPENVYFFANGMPRLLMSSVIAETKYAHQKKYLILLDQFGYNYDNLLPSVEPLFDDIFRLKISTNGYSHANQFLNVYFKPNRRLGEFFKPNSDVVLFGFRSPQQKFIIRHNQRLGNGVQIYAEGLAVDRYFIPRSDTSLVRRWGRQLFPRAFDYQHDYDAFYLFDTNVYRQSPYFEKLRTMFNLFGSEAFSKYAAQLTGGLDVKAINRFDTVFFGQPLSNFDNIMSQTEEEKILKRIVGEKEALILPHPNEILGDAHKYDCLPNAKLYSSPVPNDLLLWKLRPNVTITYSSTIGVIYAMTYPETTNYFYPIRRQQYDMLTRYRETHPNMVVSDEYVRS